MPNEEDFKVFLIQAKSGDPHPDTGIPPSFVTIKCETLPGKGPQFCLEMGRPTKVHFSLARLKKINSISNKVRNSYSCVICIWVKIKKLTILYPWNIMNNFLNCRVLLSVFSPLPSEID